jgi:hypothetical protein
MTATTAPSRIARIGNTIFVGINIFCIVCAFVLFPLAATLSGPMRLGNKIAIFPFVIYGGGAVCIILAIVIGTRHTSAHKEVPDWIWLLLMSSSIMMLCMGVTPMLIECFGVGGACGGPLAPAMDGF